MSEFNDGYIRGFEDGYRNAQMQLFGIQQGTPMMGPALMPLEQVRDFRGALEQPKPKKKGRVSAYNRRLGKAIKDLTARHKTKAGKWKKGWSQKRMMQAAHKAAKR